MVKFNAFLPEACIMRSENKGSRFFLYLITQLWHFLRRLIHAFPKHGSATRELKIIVRIRGCKKFEQFHPSMRWFDEYRGGLKNGNKFFLHMSLSSDPNANSIRKCVVKSGAVWTEGCTKSAKQEIHSTSFNVSWANQTAHLNL